MKINVIDNGYEKHVFLLKKTIESKIPIIYETDGMQIELCMNNQILSTESYLITGKDNNWKIIGSDELGLYYGIGKFLHSAKWTEDSFIPNPPVEAVTPACHFRAIYFSVHFYNWYHMASLQETQEYLESMLLWGYNTIVCIIPVNNLDRFEGPDYDKSREKTREIYKIAKSLGMKVGTIITPNQGFKTTSHELDADPSCYDHRTGANGRNVCPAKPGAREYLRSLWIHIFELYADIGLDYVFTWPYDEGGCGCEVCSPWGAKGFLDLSHETFQDAKRYFPNVQCILATWYFDEYKDGPHDQGEYAGLYRRLQEDMSYVDYIMVDGVDEFPEYPLQHDVVKPIINFPEISMWGLYSWGGRGANPLPKRFQRIWNHSNHKLSGGMPYSEGIFEDISKIQWIGYYFEPDKDYKEILKEYICYEYSDEVVDEVIEMMECIEENHVRVAKGQKPLMQAAICAEQLADKVDGLLSVKAKEAWRWRILYIRAKIDRIAYEVYFDKYQEVEGSLYDLQRTKEWYLADSEEAQLLMQELCEYYHTIDLFELNKWTFPPVKDGKVNRG